MVGFKEHSVMYPVDLLKVRFCVSKLSQISVSGWTNGLSQFLDSHANPEPFKRRPVHGPDQCGFHNLSDRRLADTMEGCFECNCRRW